MLSPAVVPALALVAGAACGALADLASIPFAIGGAALALTAAACWRTPRTSVAASAAAFLACGVALGSDARDAALRTPCGRCSTRAFPVSI
jgi:hypothetical protein